MTAAGKSGSCTSAIVFRSFARAIGIAERGGRGQMGRTITGFVDVFSCVHDRDEADVEEPVVEEPEEPPRPAGLAFSWSSDSPKSPRAICGRPATLGTARSFALSLRDGSSPGVGSLPEGRHRICRQAEGVQGGCGWVLRVTVS